MQMTQELAEATRLRDVYLRDQAHVQTLMTMADAINTGLRLVADRESVQAARRSVKDLRNHLSDANLGFEHEVDEQNATITRLRNEALVS